MSKPSDDPNSKRPFLPYSRPVLAEDDLAAVAGVLSSSTISQGEWLQTFESEFASFAGVPFAIAFSSGTAAIHAMCHVAGIGPGDEVILPALTFAGTANAVRYCGGTPVFADIDPATHCIAPDDVASKISPATKAILAVDFAGHPCDYGSLRDIARKNDLLLLADAAHAAGASVAREPVGSLADMTAFSFNPVKNMTAAEGGMVTTRSTEWAGQLRMFGTHGMTRDAARLEGAAPAGWYYEQQFLGFNYKLSELHAALGTAQLRKLDQFNRRRAQLAAVYDSLLADLPLVLPHEVGDVQSAWHLYVVRLPVHLASRRDALFEHLRSNGYGVQLHYIPVPRHPDYRRLGFSMDGLPQTEAYFASALSLPLNPIVTEADCRSISEILRAFLRDSPDSVPPAPHE